MEPRPQSHVPMHMLLDEIVRLNDLDPEEVDRVMVEAQEQEKKK